MIIVAVVVADYLNVMRNLSAGHDYLLITNTGERKQNIIDKPIARQSLEVLPNKLFDSAKLLRR
jgi:hypothetical protein